MLHQKIVHLKETGGSCWLRQLNDLLLSEGHSPLDPAIKTSCDVPSELPLSNSVNRRAGPTSFPLGHLKRMQRKVHESESASRDDGEPNRKTKKPANIMLPETLPSAADGAVCAYLQSLLPSRSHKAADASEQFQELPIHVMWCTAMMHHTKQVVEFPACVFITTENVHVFSVRSLAGDTGIPELSRTMRLPLEKVTQIAVGYDSLYIQLEWAATEPRIHGLVVFLTFSHGKSNAFINAVKLARRRSVPELDEYEDPHIVPGNGLEASLKQALMFYERCLDLDGIHVLLYLLVMVEGCSPDTVRTSSLVVTSRYIYLVSQDYCNTPLSSFAKASPSGPAYEVVSIFPVSSRLVNIQMYDIDTIESSSCHSLWSTFGKTGSARGSSVGFIGYGVRMSFHLGEYGIQVLDVRMPTSNQREKFLSTLIKVHASVSDVLTRSSLQRIKTPSPMRDADSLSCGSCESQRSSGQPKGKKSRKRPTETLNPFQTAEEHTICTTHEKNQISDNTMPDLRSSSNLDRGDSKILNSVVTIAEVTSPSVFRLPNGKFESSVISEKDPIRPGPDTAPMLSPTFEPRVGGDNPALSSTDNQPLPVVSGNVQFSEKDFNGHDSSTCDKNSVHDDEIEQNESTSKTILYDSEILQDPVGFGKSHDGPQENTSLSSASSSDEESSYEDAVKQGHCEDGRVATENTPADTQFVSDSDIAVVRLSVGEVGSTNRRSSVNSASKNSSFRCPPAVNDMVLHLGKEKGRYIAGKSETAPLSSHFGYPSNELLLHLAEHFEAAVALFPPVSPQFEAFMSLSSLELVNYFHQNIAVISVENEELSHVMWSFVVPYVNPSAEIPSCVLLSTKAIYFASDRCEHKHTPVSALKSHKRCFSDTLPLPPGSNSEFDERSAKRSPCHLSCGILNNSAGSEQKRVFRVYGTIMLKDLKQVNIGIFSQWIRLTGPGEELVYSCVTRDCRASETFLHRLKGILTRFYPLPSPEANVQDLEQDFYSMFSKSKPKSKFSDDGRFVYPLDDSISDTTFLIRRSLKGDKASTTGIRLLSYLLCFQVDSGLSCDVPPDLLRGKPRTVILTEEHLVLAVEDHVSYPLPDFTRTPPARPQMEIAEVRRLDFLQQIALRPDDAHLLVLVFSDETGELVVDTSVEHFGADGEQAPQKPAQRLQEIRWTLLVQNVNAKDKLIRLISQQWEEQHGGRQLSISTLS